MRLIVWLWNYPDEYKLTRHNLGFLFVDYLQDKYSFDDFKLDKKFKWEISTWKIWIEKVILLKPYTYMNLSWESVRELASYYKLENDDIMVVYDDISMEFWKIRYRDKWSAGGQNWVKNIIKFFWESFPRIKVGVWYNEKYWVSDWVLSKFTKEEIEELKAIFAKTEDVLKENL